MSKLNYMPIVPVGMFDILDDSGVDDVFILPQFFSIPEYKEYYTSRSWRNVIIDNSLYENQEYIPFEEMIEMSKIIEGENVYIVAPEDLHSGIATGALTIQTAKIITPD